MQTNTLLLCRGMCERLPFVLIGLARASIVYPGIVHGPKHGFLPRNGTNDHERLVPFRSDPQGQIGLRHALRVGSFLQL